MTVEITMVSGARYEMETDTSWNEDTLYKMFTERRAALVCVGDVTLVVDKIESYKVINK